MRVFENAAFIACDKPMNQYKYLVENHGRILYIGEDLPQIYQGVTRREDLGGRTVIPALGDSHMHFLSYSWVVSGLDLRNAGSYEEIASRVQSYASSHRNEPMIFGYGVSPMILREKRLPDRHDLDRFCQRPLLIEKYDGQAAVANTALIETFSDFVRSAGGFSESSGWLYLNAHRISQRYLNSLMKPGPMLSKVAQAADRLAAMGIGMVATAEGMGFPRDTDIDFMMKMGRALPQQFRIYLQTIEEGKALERQLPRIGGCLASALDGSFGSEDAALRRPYDNNLLNCGTLTYTQGQTSSFVDRANRAGLQIALHAVGDAAVEQAIAAFEHALELHPRENHRHTIIHGDLFPEDLIERAAAMNLCLSAQPSSLYWEAQPRSYIEGLIKQRADDLLPLRSIIQSGIVVAGGSDAPAMDPNPFHGIWAACNHPNPDQRISVEEALKFYTRNAAYMTFDDNYAGTLERGKWVNLAVLSENPLEITGENLKNVQVEALYIRGKKYQRQEGGTLGLMIRSWCSKASI